MVDFFKSGDSDDDGLKLQVASNRLKLITTNIAVVNRNLIKLFLLYNWYTYNVVD